MYSFVKNELKKTVPDSLDTGLKLGIRGLKNARMKNIDKKK